MSRMHAFLRRLRRPVEPAADPRPELSLCRRCGAEFTWPVEWDVHDATSWWIRLRCGECGHEREVVAAEDDAIAFDEALGRHAASIERAVEQLDQARMAIQVESFALALELDLVDAADFA